MPQGLLKSREVYYILLGIGEVGPGMTACFWAVPGDITVQEDSTYFGTKVKIL